MRWEGREGSQNVEDQRRKKMVRTGAAGIGIGTIALVLLMTFLGEGDSASRMLEQAQQQSQQQQQQQQHTGGTSAADDELAAFVSVVLKDTEDIWNRLFREQLGQEYQEPRLVLFNGEVRSACGFASAATGPFYCPGDQKLYIDLSFYQDLKRRYNAPGDFAMAYVVAHEVAHHVQFLLGITQEVHKKKGRISEKEYNKLSVRMELQADFLAGVWAHHAHKMKNILEEGDIQEALNAAHAIGDDRIQKQARGYVVPDSFTHGTSEQRMRWFTKGIKTGDLRMGDTFDVSDRDL